MILAAISSKSGSIMENVGSNIIHHVSNSDISHPIIKLPVILGVDFSVTKHVLMLWIVTVILCFSIIIPIRIFLSKNTMIHKGWVYAIELVGMIPIFDTIGLVNRFVLGISASDSHNVINGMLHGGVTATGNFNVTGALAVITFFLIIIAGTKAHGFLNHWKNLVPSGLAWPVYIILIPIEFIGMLVKPFALTMRLAANMTGGHIALLALLSLMAIFGEMFQSALAGIAVAFISVPMAVAVSGLEIIVILVQAYVFTLLSAVFVGMAINVHH